MCVDSPRALDVDIKEAVVATSEGRVDAGARVRASLRRRALCTSAAGRPPNPRETADGGARVCVQEVSCSLDGRPIDRTSREPIAPADRRARWRAGGNAIAVVAAATDAVPRDVLQCAVSGDDDHCVIVARI